ncbi:MAG: signal recognition particle-docking protein FtsY [Nanoarchaeota archaeon]|nr:signal recognition particle-docking protein FtsY [Nanoarchaeota archaeon]MBU1854755.1 signal recognition particle-docking protein FtsY [Nanoarchaeota archaeon]
MFKFLKDKLKGVVDSLKKGVEKEVEQEVVEVEKKPKEKPKKELKKATEKKLKKEVKKDVEKKEKKEETKGVKITYFVHGTTTDNEEGLATGQADGELSELGIRQAKELPEQTKYKFFDVMFSSDLKRAVVSAEEFKDVCPLKKDKRLRESDYGEFTQKKDDWNSMDYIEEPFPKGESYREVEKRIAEFLNYIYKNYYGKHIAIIAHKAPQLAIEVLLLGKSWEQAIEDDWRPKKEWQPGWDYFMKEEVVVPEIKKKGFFKKIFSKKEEVEVVEHQVEEKTPEVVEKAEEVKAPEEENGFFKKLTETVTKFNLSENKFDDLFWELEVILLENNFAVEVIEKIKNDLKEELTTGKVSRKGVEEVIKDTLKKSIKEVLDVESFDLVKKAKGKKPFIMAFIGVNGSGKTTNMAKVAHLLQKNGLSVVFAASDTFRAAAIQQLEEHANNLKIKMIKHDYNADSAAVAFDAIEHAKAKGIDVVMIDTAGRLHSNTNLMQELKKLIRVNNPDLKIFVGESITGNDCIEQAKVYNEEVGIDAIILSKADVDEKGGAAISVSYITKKPIIYIGTGQTYNDLKKFDKELVLESLGL